MEFVKLLVTLILAIYAQRGLPVDGAQQQRLEGVANDIWAVTDSVDSNKMGPFVGEASHEANALALTTIAAHESGCWEKVQTCEICYYGSLWGDKGRSVSLYQLHEGSASWGGFSRKEICDSNRVATKLAWNIVRRNKNSSTSLNLFKGYARGGRRLAAWEMDNIFQNLLLKSNIKLSYGGQHMVATFKKPIIRPASNVVPTQSNQALQLIDCALYKKPTEFSFSYTINTPLPLI